MRDDLLLGVVDLRSCGDWLFVYFAIDKSTDFALYSGPSIDLE